MEPQLMLTNLHERFPSQVTGQHDMVTEEGESANDRPDVAGVVLALLALIGIMLAIAALDGSTVSIPASLPSHLMFDVR